jgi:hypothetical protein
MAQGQLRSANVAVWPFWSPRVRRRPVILKQLLTRWCLYNRGYFQEADSEDGNTYSYGRCVGPSGCC